MCFSSPGVRKDYVNEHTHTTGLSSTSAADLPRVRGLSCLVSPPGGTRALQQPPTQRETLSPSFLQGEGKRIDYMPKSDPIVSGPRRPAAQDGRDLCSCGPGAKFISLFLSLFFQYQFNTLF